MGSRLKEQFTQKRKVKSFSCTRLFPHNLKQVPGLVSRLGEFCDTVLLWSSTNILWTKKLHPICCSPNSTNLKFKHSNVPYVISSVNKFGLTGDRGKQTLCVKGLHRFRSQTFGEKRENLSYIASFVLPYCHSKTDAEVSRLCLLLQKLLLLWKWPNAYLKLINNAWRQRS